MTVNYEQLADTYSKHRTCDEAIVFSLLEGCPLTQESRVLELGADTGNYSAALRRLIPCALTLVDRSGAMLEVAGRRDPSFSTVVASAERVPFKQESFDLVFCVDVVHHIDDLSAFFAEAFRVLAPSGQIYDKIQAVPWGWIGRESPCDECSDTKGSALSGSFANKSAHTRRGCTRCVLCRL